MFGILSSLAVRPAGWCRIGLAYARRRPRALPSVILPLALKPKIAVYPHHAHLGGILGDDLADSVVVNHYVNLVAIRENQAGALPDPADPRPPVHVDFSPYLGLYSCADLKLVRTEDWAQAWLAGTSADLIRRVHETLARGRYLQVHVDDFYVPGTPCWARVHFRHHLLIHGYDADDDSFLCACYDRRGNFRVSRMPRLLLYPAVTSAVTTDRGRYSSNLRVLTAWIAEPHPQPLLPDQIQRDLTDFMTGQANPYCRQEHAIYGIRVIEYLCTYFAAQLQHGLSLDVRITRLLWEREKAMRVRLRHLAAAGYATARGIQPAAAKVEQQLHALHLEAFAANIEGGRGRSRSDRLEAYPAVLRASVECFSRLHDTLRRPMETGARP